MIALERGQVDELVLTATMPQLAVEDEDGSDAEDRMILADALVTKARQTGANIAFIENEDLLAGIGGVGAFLRYQS